ncbi:MAG: sensor histidine kinase [Oscillospiraceae bacterium]|nr:sensor histidine kinase [Oscillospiraceae bacterium]
MLLAVLFYLTRSESYTVLIVWCGATASEKFSVQLLRVVRAVAGFQDKSDIVLFPALNHGVNYLIYLSLYTALIAALFFIFGNGDLSNEDSYTRRRITALSISSTLMLALLSDLVRESGSDGLIYGVSLALIMLVCLLVLFIRSGIARSAVYRREIRMMQELLSHERRQYQEMKDSIDYINMKCHDIKHQLASFHGRLTDDEIKLLQQAVDIYDGSIKTGSETLDVVLYEKQLLCREKKIELSYLADGHALDFMSKTHLYSLMTNALGNAVEAADKVGDAEKRLINLTVESVSGETSIEISNYFSEAPRVYGGELVTSKNDVAHHGLGFQSMRFISSQYGGTVCYEIIGDIFHLIISFPEGGRKKRDTSSIS